jgi:DNA-binding NarL/FixJ family response regulator
MGTDADSPPPLPSPVRIGIVEDDAVLRDALGLMVEQVDGFALHGSCGTVADGLELLEREPDVLLVDLGLPDGSGLELIERAPESCRVLVLTVFADVRTVVQAIEAGADGYLLKESDVGQVAAAIRTVLAGGAPISPAVASHILARVRNEQPAAEPAVAGATGAAGGTDGVGLTAREREILQDLAGGRSIKEVAHLHGISHHTVGDHVKAIYRKLSVNSRSQAVNKAVRSGIIRLGG